MANDNSPSNAPEVVGISVEVSNHLVGRSVVDGIRRSFTAGGQEQVGDEFMDQSRELLHRHLRLIELDTQRVIQEHITKARGIKNSLEDESVSRFRKLIQAREYRRISRRTFKIIKRASDRAIEDRLLNQITQATGGSGVEPGNSSGTASTRSNPFSDSHAISTLTDIHVNDLDEVELSTFKTDDNSDAAAILDLVRSDGSIRHLVATFSVEAFSGNGTEGEASQSVAPGAAALSIHREDGTSPSLVPTPLPFLSPDDRRNHDAETHTISSVAPSVVFDQSK